MVHNQVLERTKATELGPDDLVDEGEQHGNSKIYDKCRKGWRKKPGATRGSKGSCVKEESELEQGFEEMMGQFAETEAEVQEAYINTSKDAVEVQAHYAAKEKQLNVDKMTIKAT